MQGGEENVKKPDLVVIDMPPAAMLAKPDVSTNVDVAETPRASEEEAALEARSLEKSEARSLEKLETWSIEKSMDLRSDKTADAGCKMTTDTGSEKSTDLGSDKTADAGSKKTTDTGSEKSTDPVNIEKEFKESQVNTSYAYRLHEYDQHLRFRQ